MEDNIANPTEPLVPEIARAPYTGRTETDGGSPMERNRVGYRDKWK